MQLPDTDRNRVDELSAKARAGTMADEEARERDSYLHVGRLFAVMQSRTCLIPQLAFPLSG
jgi:hypothetical protein